VKGRKREGEKGGERERWYPPLFSPK